MAAQPELDAVDMHHGAVESWLQHNPGKQVSDLLSQFASLGVKAFLSKATEGRTFQDPKFHDLVNAATGLGVTRIALGCTPETSPCAATLVGRSSERANKNTVSPVWSWKLVQASERDTTAALAGSVRDFV